MTDAQLRDQACAELRLTTDSYPTWVKKGRPSSSHWAKAFTLLGQIGATSPGCGAGAVREGSAYSQPQAADLSRLDVLVVTTNSLGSPKDLASAGGKTRALLYRSAVSCRADANNSVLYSGAVANGWLLKTAAGLPVVNKGYPSNFIIDFSNPAVSAAVASSTAALCMANGFDGAWFDDVVAGCLTLCNALPDGWTQSQWYAALVAHVLRVGVSLKAAGLEVVCNANGGFATDNTDSLEATLWKALAPGVSGLSCEYWEEVDNPPTYPVFTLNSTTWTGHWDSWRSLHTLCHQLGVDFMPVVYGDPTGQNVLMLRATFLLDYDGGRSALLLADTTTNPLTGTWSRNMGVGTAPLQSGNAWVRTFTNGVVRIDPVAATVSIA
jgi:hypothetical protein